MFSRDMRLYSLTFFKYSEIDKIGSIAYWIFFNLMIKLYLNHLK